MTGRICYWRHASTVPCGRPFGHTEAHAPHSLGYTFDDPRTRTDSLPDRSGYVSPWVRRAQSGTLPAKECAR